jgi:hypothetical protein
MMARQRVIVGAAMGVAAEVKSAEQTTKAVGERA